MGCSMPPGATPKRGNGGTAIGAAGPTWPWSGRCATERRAVAVRLLILHDDLGLAKGATAYPTLPDMRFHRCQRRMDRPAPALNRAA